MKIHKNVLWITRTAVFIAATVAMQVLAAQMGNQFITGSVVNMMLILAVMICGLPSGAIVAATTPVIATLLGVGPVWPLVPFIAAGNITLVIVWRLVGNMKLPIKYVAYVAALILAASAKFSVLYFGVVKVALPYILGFPENSAPHIMLSFMFSYPQLITASIGGVCALILLPILKNAIDV